jgi:hypothetical protein
MHVVVLLQVPDIFHAACGKIVDDQDFIAEFEHSLGEMGPDKSGTASDQNAHEFSL